MRLYDVDICNEPENNRGSAMKQTIPILLCAFGAFTQTAAFETTLKPGENAFPLVGKNGSATVYYDANDWESVETVANLFADDVELVTGKRPTTSAEKPCAQASVIIGTLEKNRWIDELVASKKLDVGDIKGSWERFAVVSLDNPFPGVEKALVVVGSDRRGAAYGTFAVSEAIGVSPLHWWADVPPPRASELRLKLPIREISESPFVQYRGIFINDEGWGFRPWAAKTFEPEVGNVGPKTYAKVCELILRMKGNFLAPAMHPGTDAFNKHQENKRVADRYGIVMGSSHCEPLLFNNTTEWDRKTMGEWNYMTNRDGILKILDKRVEDVAPYENVYTLAMRGIHDAGMIGVPQDKQTEVLEKAIQDQRDIIAKHVEAPIETIPQVFVPYKEVLEIYDRGMNLPDDITLMWVDDNYGYIRRLSDAKERRRKGGSGVYYHISYLGGPHDYLWLNTTPPALMFGEMRKAYDLGAKKMWLLNVGDIKPGELGMKMFLDLAWDADSITNENAIRHQTDFLASIFGKEHQADLQDILDSYYLLGFQRKPEMMGGGEEWNTSDAQEKLCDTNFSFVNYDEADRRIREYERIAALCEKIENELPEELRPAFFQLVQYPVEGSALINAKMLLAQKNRWHARQGRASANSLAQKVKELHDGIDRLNERYNSQLNGKWNGMMMLAPGWCATYMRMPPLSTIELPQQADFGVFVPNGGPDGISAVHVLPTLNPYTDETTFFELYNKGLSPFEWTATASEPWIRLDKTSGSVKENERIAVSVDWNAAPKKGLTKGRIEIVSGDRKEEIHLPIFQPASPTREELRGLHVEDNGVVSFDPADFQRKKETNGIRMTVVEGLRNPNGSIRLGDPGMPTQGTWAASKTPCVEYDFYTFSGGPARIFAHFLPTFPIDAKAKTRIGVMIDNGLLKTLELNLKEGNGEWKEGVLWNNVVKSVPINVDKPGKHTLKLFCIDPGVVIQKIVLDFGGLKPSANGPDSTLVR